MNEQIEKFVDECQATYIDREGRYEVEFDKEKFAELIIKECAAVIQRESDKAISNFTYMGDDVPASVTQTAIKQHFGVEE